MKHLSKFYLATTIILLIMGLAACSGAPEPTATVEPTPVVEPTAATETGEKTIRLVTGVIPDAFLFRFANLVLPEAFKRNGYVATVETCPPKRCIQMVELEEVDGDATRIYDFLKDGAHPSHFRIEEHFTSSTWMAVATNPDINVSGWEDLKTNNYRVGYQIGAIKTEQNLIGFIDDDKLVAVPGSPEQGLDMLLADRYDVYLSSDGRLMETLFKTDKFKNSELRNGGIVEDVFIYPYLHIKYKELAPQIAATIKEMKEEGLLEQYEKQLMEEDAAQ